MLKAPPTFSTIQPLRTRILTPLSPFLIERLEGEFDDPHDLSLDSSSSEVDEDDDAELAAPIADNFMELLSKIKSKHPDIYDKEKSFFPNEIEIEEREKAAARVTLKDMEREDILARVAKGDDAGSDSSDEEDEETFKAKNQNGKSYVQEQEEARKALLSAAWEGDLSGSEEDEDDKVEIVKKKVQKKKELAKEVTKDTFADEAGLVKKDESHVTSNVFENEYQAFLARQEAQEAAAAKKAERKATSLLQYWKRSDLDNDEKYLRDFVLNKRWMGPGDSDEPQSKKSVANTDVDDAEDTKELEKQDDFETAYNFRFEDPNGAQLVTHARGQESVRVEKNKRAEKRARKRERQRLAKQAAEEEKIAEKKKHKEEILSRVAELAAASGLSDGVKSTCIDPTSFR